MYDEAKPLPNPALVDELNPFDDITLVPYDNQTLLGTPDRVVQLDVIMDNLGDGANYAFFNDITYVSPKVPSLYTALSAGNATAANPAIYGSNTNAFVLAQGEVVQIIVNNLDSGRHPFHLHGHQFQALYRSVDEAGTYEDDTGAPHSEDAFPAIPMRRDTFVLYPDGNMVLRFRAENPGIWLFHCHIEWHVSSGLIATFIEAPLDIPAALRNATGDDTIPRDHIAACAVDGTPTKGNAAGNSVNFLDLTGENVSPARLPDG